jgi:hypothetical protein
MMDTQLDPMVYSPPTMLDYWLVDGHKSLDLEIIRSIKLDDIFSLKW